MQEGKAAIEQHLDAIEEIVKRDPKALEDWLSDLEIAIRTRFTREFYGNAYEDGYDHGYDDAESGIPRDNELRRGYVRVADYVPPTQ